MNRAIKILTIIITIVAFNSCTQNNGNIGDLFGLWHIDELIDDNQSSDEYQDNLFLAFQSEVTTLTEVYDYNQSDIKYGSWSREGDALYLIFDEPAYVPFAVSGFSVGTNECTIIELNSSSLILEHQSNDGKHYHYTLSKR